MNGIITDIERNFSPSPTDSPYNSLFKEYERVIVESLITSFGLDFLITDRHGGDVDTVHNVRQIGKDSNMTYKSKVNESTYNSQDSYSKSIHDQWHKNGVNFANTKHQARERYQQNGTLVRDQYDGGDLYLTKASGIPPQKRAELDHIVSTYEIYNDRGRVLSGVSGQELADQPSNFAWTNKSRNASMGKHSNSEYVARHPELSEETKQNILNVDAKARREYNRRINQTYYTSSGFMTACVKSGAIVGVKMGLRQAVGMIFYEIWDEAKKALKNRSHSRESLFKAIGNAVKRGWENAKGKYKNLWNKFIDGTISGLLSSLTTTICNIFFTTAKNIVRIIRQTWASLVEATKILLFNPDCLPFGERFRSAAKIIATGASVVVGTLAGEAISKCGIGSIPVLGDIISTFCGTLVTGIMSCSLLYLLDKNPFINAVVELLNMIPTVDDHIRYYRQQAAILEAYCAELMSIDLKKFQNEVASYHNALKGLSSVHTDQELNSLLRRAMTQLAIPMPYDTNQSFDSFMTNRNNKLIFR